MTKLLSTFIFSVIGIAGLSLLFASPVQAATLPGDLIKCPKFTAVYYLAEDGKRYVFPNSQTYFTHFDDFESVKTMTCSNLAKFSLGGNIPYRAGTKMLKMPSVPVVYAVEPEGVLRAIQSEEQARTIYGDDWASKIDDLSEAFFSTYSIGDPLADGELPAGIVLENAIGELHRIGTDGVGVKINTIETFGTFPNLIRNKIPLSNVSSYLSNPITVTDDYASIINVREDVMKPFIPFSILGFERFFSYATDDEHIRGDLTKAKVVLIEYSDFQCPFCARHHPNMKQLMEDYGDDIAWVYRHFPLSFHPQALPAANASECAAEQGKFWEFADEIFDNQSSLGRDYYISLASSNNLNINQFTDCYDTSKYSSRIQLNAQWGEDNGVAGTPATFVNDVLVSGAVPYITLTTVIDEELAKW